MKSKKIQITLKKLIYIYVFTGVFTTLGVYEAVKSYDLSQAPVKTITLIEYTGGKHFGLSGRVLPTHGYIVKIDGKFETLSLQDRFPLGVAKVKILPKIRKGIYVAPDKELSLYDYIGGLSGVVTSILWGWLLSFLYYSIYRVHTDKEKYHVC